MPQNENTPTETPAMTVEQAEYVMQQRLTRRAALRKLGFGAGLAALALLSTDDLARMVGKRLEQIAGDNRTAETVARELQGAGMAFAGGLQPPNPTPCGVWETGNHGGDNASSVCSSCNQGTETTCDNTAGTTIQQCNDWAAQCGKFCSSITSGSEASAYN